MPDDILTPARPKKSTAQTVQDTKLAKQQLKTFSIASRDTALKLIARKPDPEAAPPIPERKISIDALRPQTKRFHGAKLTLAYFPGSLWRPPCADKFGYLTSKAIRDATKLPFDLATQTLLGKLGDFMADVGRGPGADSTIPAGYTYFGQFVDHDITLDIASTLDTPVDATKIHNMRTPSLDLDSVYARGPALDSFLYAFPTSGPPTAVKMQLGSNLIDSDGGPGGAGGIGAIKKQRNFDVPRVVNPLDPSLTTNTAIIGDPRNDENLIVSQFHHAMLKFHNQVVDGLVATGFSGDIFVEAKKIVTHHYQWAVVHDFLARICGAAAVSNALATISAAPNSAFAMPVEFAVGAYRFGHSMIREQYWVNFVQINASLGQVFSFVRSPNLPVRSSWVVDFNAFFTTGFSVPVNNKAKKIDSVMAPGLDTLPGFSGLMAMLATRNLRRGIALGMPSGQGVAQHYGIAPMTAAQIKTGLPAGEAALLDSNGGILLSKTPLWYYVLREAAVLNGGNQLGPVGARVVAETFVRMLKRNPDSFLNVSGGFTPGLPAATPGDFTVADLVNFAGVTVP